MLRQILATMAISFLALGVASVAAQEPTPTLTPSPSVTSMPTASASPVPSPTTIPVTPTPEPAPLRYRLIVEPAGFAVDGSSVTLFAPGPQAGHLFVCAEGTVQSNRTEVQVELTATCPEGTRIIPLVYRPGEFGITADAVPEVQWRNRRAGDPP